MNRADETCNTDIDSSKLSSTDTLILTDFGKCSTEEKTLLLTDSGKCSTEEEKNKSVADEIIFDIKDTTTNSVGIEDTSNRESCGTVVDQGEIIKSSLESDQHFENQKEITKEVLVPEDKDKNGIFPFIKATENLMENDDMLKGEELPENNNSNSNPEGELPEVHEFEKILPDGDEIHTESSHIPNVEPQADESIPESNDNQLTEKIPDIEPQADESIPESNDNQLTENIPEVKIQPEADLLKEKGINLEVNIHESKSAQLEKVIEVLPERDDIHEDVLDGNNVCLEEESVGEDECLHVNPDEILASKHGDYTEQEIPKEMGDNLVDQLSNVDVSLEKNDEHCKEEQTAHFEEVIPEEEKAHLNKEELLMKVHDDAHMHMEEDLIDDGDQEVEEDNVEQELSEVKGINPEETVLEQLGDSSKDAEAAALPEKCDLDSGENLQPEKHLHEDVKMIEHDFVPEDTCSLVAPVKDETETAMQVDPNTEKVSDITNINTCTLETESVEGKLCSSKLEDDVKNQHEGIFTTEINMIVDVDNLHVDTSSNLPVEDNSVPEGIVQPDDSVAVEDAQSIITGLVDYPSDSEDLSVKHNELETEIPKSQTLVHTPCFEEDAQSSWSVDTSKVTPVKIKQLTSTIDEDSRASSISQKSACKRPHSDEESLHVFTAEQMFEYRWPADGGEFYLVQEHVSEFLGVKSFKRKYPDCTRRPAEVAEKRYLKDKGVVSETQCDLGLTAIRTDDVLELMSKDYPEKYQDYIRVLQERERQKINSKHKEYSTPSIDKTKMNDFVQKAMKATAEFNMHLNQERREERRTSFDMQTFTIHVPANKIVKLSKEATKVGKYPVALLPGQFQDYYRPYSSQELKYFPINTVLYGPLKELPTVYTQPSSDGSQSDSEDSCASEGSCCSSSQGTHDSGDSSSGSEPAPTSKFKTENPDLHVPTLRIKDRLTSTCKVCHGTLERNKEGYSEDLIHCSECGSSGHPSCLDITSEMFEAIRTYAWQCMDCKTCMLCMDPYDEDKMMFCDKCDRGYHTFCVGLKNLPNGRWICQLCGQCSGCSARTPGPEGSKAQWQQDSSSKLAADKKPQLLCLACAKPSKR